MTEQVDISDGGGILRIRMNRPEKKNALTRPMYQAMAEGIERAESDPGIRVVTISGSEDAFTSGNDLADFLNVAESSDGNPALRFLSAISTARKPLLAGVNGFAVGIGVTMLLHCDVVYAAERATFQLPFVNLGLVPEAASSFLLPRLVGHHRAADLLLFGNKFNAIAAKEMGLVSSIHPRSELDAILEERAAALSAKPPEAVRITKELLKGAAFDSAVSAQLGLEQEHFRKQLRSSEAREAMEAVLQKRAPDFSRLAPKRA
ncbi:MAG TPA: enoyl-CoA hydratase [Blastocatellia bacterium]|nr:enoyl-CoA hydratase [Blastocatellia bacterium]